MSQETALIVGAGAGLSASLARLFAREQMGVAVAARQPEKLKELVAEIDGRAYACDATSPDAVAALFTSFEADFGTPDIVVYNPSARQPGGIAEIDADAVRDALMVTCFGGFLVGQQAARRMRDAGRGSILLTGASASVKGYAKSASFAMGKFGLRGLAQSMARELAPQNIHVAHFVIDGAIRSAARGRIDENDSFLDPDAIAQSYLDIHRQHRSAWTWEIELRPWVENF